VLTTRVRSEQADLIVVGSHGRSGMKKFLLGSVASHVVTLAPCPVLVVNAPNWTVPKTNNATADSDAKKAVLPIL